MRFEFATATRIIFGPGTVKESIPIARSLGDRALLVMGKSSQRAAGLIRQFREAGIFISEFHVSGEPTVTEVDSGLEQVRTEHCDLVISLGGGSAIDAGKAIAILMTNPGQIYDYLEVIGKGKPFTQTSAPYIAIPTTAGTGSEVTRNAVITVPDQQVKVSLRSPGMLARTAIVDPELTYSLPPDITAATGLDALTQLVEPFLSNASNPITDAICREGMHFVSRSLRRAYENNDDPHAREDMAIGSLFSGMALANAKLGAVHGFAGPIGGMFSAPHGAICARLLPLVVERNMKAIKDRAGQSSILERFDELGRLLTGDPSAKAGDGIRWLHEVGIALKVPPLATYGLKKSDFPEIISRAKNASSMKGNPVDLKDSELSQILEMAL
jgi:alcohol dehydrogenase class IV